MVVIRNKSSSLHYQPGSLICKRSGAVELARETSGSKDDALIPGRESHQRLPSQNTSRITAPVMATTRHGPPPGINGIARQVGLAPGPYDADQADPEHQQRQQDNPCWPACAGCMKARAQAWKLARAEHPAALICTRRSRTA
jgi:hypothetical protein